MNYFKNMSLKRKIALLPILSIVVLVFFVGNSSLGFSRIRHRVDDVVQSFKVRQEIAVLIGKLAAVNGETHQLIVWASSGYPEEKRIKLESSIRSLLKDMEQTITPEVRYEILAGPYKQYEEWILKTIDMAVIDASAASMFAGSVDESFHLINSEMRKMDELAATASSTNYDAAMANHTLIVRSSQFIGVAAMVLFVILAFFIIRSIIRAIGGVADGLADGARKVSLASNAVSTRSQQLAEVAAEQASAIDQTTASLEQALSMIARNASSAVKADNIMKETGSVVHQAASSMETLTRSMAEITSASQETQKIVKTIDEIAFQTNLLALNAAVEAARAGESGAGFAVVAGEVRHLAMRAAEAARNTADLIDGTVRKVKDGAGMVNLTSAAFGMVSASVESAVGLVDEIARSTKEQDQGIEHIKNSLSELDKATQQNATHAEQTASAAEDLNAQAVKMDSFATELREFVGGGD
ncbi:MAG: methyl-accepting chemotaxis protein [Desulfobacteraceae bacterium]|jgi:methyl-accepting chemotaxis protein